MPTREPETITVHAGDSLPLRVIIDDAATGQPLDLSAYAAIRVALAARAEPGDDPTAVVTHQLGDGAVALAPGVAGGLDIDLLPEDTRQRPGTYPLQIRLERDARDKRTAGPLHLIRIVASPLE